MKFKRGDLVIVVNNKWDDNLIIGDTHFIGFTANEGESVRLVGFSSWSETSQFEIVSGLTPHKHCEVIKAWADGHEIEEKWPSEPDCAYQHKFDLTWNCNKNYRIKPTNPNADAIAKMEKSMADMQIELNKLKEA